MQVSRRQQKQVVTVIWPTTQWQAVLIGQQRPHRHEAHIQEAVQQAHGNRERAEVEIEVNAGLRSEMQPESLQGGDGHACCKSMQSVGLKAATPPELQGRWTDEVPGWCISTCTNTDTSRARFRGQGGSRTTCSHWTMAKRCVTSK